MLLSATAIATVAAAATLSPPRSALIAVAIALAALALAPFVARRPRLRHHRPHCHRRRCSPATLVVIALAAVTTTLFIARHLRCDPVLATVAVAVRRPPPLPQFSPTSASASATTPPPSHLPRLVVALPLVAPPLPPLTPFRVLLRIPHPPPEGFSFGRWTPADEWTKMGALLGFWLGGGMWCIFNTPEKNRSIVCS